MIPGGVLVSRIQLALNVSDLDAAIAFYSKLFGTEPAKVRPGYANFAVVDPPLKLVLIEGQGAGGTLNHLGVEVASTDAVGAAHARLAGEGLATAVEEQVTCCYAVQDKVWVDGPDAEPWEVYTVLADAEMPAGQLRTSDPGSCGPACCDGEPAAEASGGCDEPVAEASGCCDEPVAEDSGCCGQPVGA
jgi:catechol 2,3-dioxygenase-like lactoylglutathione lyase family enzyme